jgi:hypothetical protein
MSDDDFRRMSDSQLIVARVTVKNKKSSIDFNGYQNL